MLANVLEYRQVCNGILSCTLALWGVASPPYRYSNAILPGLGLLHPALLFRHAREAACSHLLDAPCLHTTLHRPILTLPLLFPYLLHEFDDPAPLIVLVMLLTWVSIYDMYLPSSFLVTWVRFLLLAYFFFLPTLDPAFFIWRFPHHLMRLVLVDSLTASIQCC